MLKRLQRSAKVWMIFALLDQARNEKVIQDFQLKVTGTIIKFYLSEDESTDQIKYTDFVKKIKSVGFMSDTQGWFWALL